MRYYLFFLLFIFSFQINAQELGTYIQTYPVQYTNGKPDRIDVFQNNSKPDCSWSNEESCFDSCPSGYGGAHIVYFGGNSSAYRKRCYACPPNSDVYATVGYTEKKVDPFTTSVGGYGWTCKTKYCPNTWTLSGDGTICTKEFKCQPGIYNQHCPPPTYPAKCLSDQEEFEHENGSILCLQTCPEGSIRDTETLSCVFNEIEKPEIIGNNEGGCKGSVIDGVKCLEQNTVNALDDVSNKTDNIFSDLLNKIKEYFDNKEDDSEANENDDLTIDHVNLDNIELPFFNNTITIESKSLFPSNVSCPPDNSINLLAKTFSFSYSKLCSYLNLLSNVVMILAFYFGYKIVRSE